MITQPLSRMALDVQVPPPDETARNKTPPSQIVLELADDGGYAINGQPVPKDQLDTQIHAIYDPRPAKLLFIKAGPEPDLPGRDRGDGRRPGRGGPDHRIHAEGSGRSRRERRRHSSRAGTGLPVPARAFGPRASLSGAVRRLWDVGRPTRKRAIFRIRRSHPTRGIYARTHTPGSRSRLAPPLRRPGWCRCCSTRCSLGWWCERGPALVARARAGRPALGPGAAAVAGVPGGLYYPAVEPAGPCPGSSRSRRRSRPRVRPSHQPTARPGAGGAHPRPLDTTCGRCRPASRPGTAEPASGPRAAGGGGTGSGRDGRGQVRRRPRRRRWRAGRDLRPPELRDLAFPFDTPPKELRGASLDRDVLGAGRRPGRALSGRSRTSRTVTTRKKFDEVMRAFRFTPARRPERDASGGNHDEFPSPCQAKQLLIAAP